MKQGKSLVELAQELDRQQKAKRDLIADTRSLTFTETAELVGKNGDLPVFAAPMTTHARRQLGEHVGIPAKYFDRMIEKAPALAAANVNHWLRSEPAPRMVRMLDGRVRAFLSDRYRALDNFDLANAVLPVLVESGCQVESCEVTERRLYIKAINENIRREFMPPGAKRGVGHVIYDVLTAGIVISNSEIGDGALAIQPAIKTKSCTNLAVWSENTMRKYHVGRAAELEAEIAEIYSDNTKRLADAALWSQVADLVRASLDGTIFNRIAEKILASMDSQPMANPVKAIEDVSKTFGFSGAEAGGILAHLIQGGDVTKYGMHAAVTRYAQDVDSYDRASELERVGAQIIDLPAADWKRIAEAA